MSKIVGLARRGGRAIRGGRPLFFCPAVPRPMSNPRIAPSSRGCSRRPALPNCRAQATGLHAEKGRARGLEASLRHFRRLVKGKTGRVRGVTAYLLTRCCLKTRPPLSRYCPLCTSVPKAYTRRKECKHPGACSHAKKNRYQFDHDHWSGAHCHRSGVRVRLLRARRPVKRLLKEERLPCHPRETPTCDDR